MVDAGAVGPAQHDTVMVAFIPGLEIDATNAVAPGLHQPQHITIKVDRWFEFSHPDLRMAGPQHPCERHFKPSQSTRPYPDNSERRTCHFFRRSYTRCRTKRQAMALDARGTLQFRRKASWLFRFGDQAADDCRVDEFADPAEDQAESGIDRYG